MKSAAQEPQIELVAVGYLENEAALSERWNDVKARIARRAYELYEHRGKAHGHDVDDWLEAEIETLTFPVVIRDTEHLCTIDAEISGFNVDELKVHVTPFRIFITGRKRSAADSVSRDEFKQMFKVVDLPYEIDPHTVIAELTKNTLTVSMRKLPLVTSVERKEQFSKSWRSRSGQLRKRADIAKRYADAARDQLHRATAKQKKARAMAFGSEADINMRSKQELANTNEKTRRREEESRLQVT